MKKKLKYKYLISSLFIIVLFLIMLLVFYQNITLKKERNKLNEYLDEYKVLKEEIDYLEKISTEYEVAIKNNKLLSNEKDNLQSRKNELNIKIKNVKSKIEELK